MSLVNVFTNYISPSHELCKGLISGLISELMVKAYSNCLVRAIGKALPMQFS